MGNLCAVFKIFGLSHILIMLLGIVIATTLILVCRKFDGKVQKNTSWVLIGIMCLLVVLEMIGMLISKVKFFECLPLNSWSVFVYLSIFIQITERENWIKFGYFIIVPLSVIALFITPNYLTLTSSWSISVISYFFTNAILIAYYILKLIWSDEYLSKKDILNCFLNYVIIMSITHILNVILRFTTLAVHANYMGTMGEEYDVLNKLLYTLIKVPFVHQLPFYVLVLGIGYLMILPFDVLKSKKDRADQMEELVALGNLKAQQDYIKSRKRRTASQILVNSESKAKPAAPKNVNTSSNSSGFVSVNKQVNVNKDSDNK